jgi:hypothetical protein
MDGKDRGLADEEGADQGDVMTVPPRMLSTALRRHRW